MGALKMLESWDLRPDVIVGTSMGAIIGGLYASGKRALESLRKLTKNKEFHQTRIPFACNAVDLLTGREVVLDEGNVAEAIRASMSLPGIFEPVRWKDMLLVYGGVLNN
ncbi:MAG: hypothetical protein FVQ80_17990, partial [Planctomycetes bacterium]|nr:hypothetical protein [Planctomycetota bacterium]